MVIFHIKIHLHIFFQIFLSNRVLWRGSFLVVNFSPCYLNGKKRSPARALADPIGPFYHMEHFLLFFWKRLPTGERKKKNFGNKERPTI